MSEFIVEDKPWSMRPKFNKLQGPLCDSVVDPYYITEKKKELVNLGNLLYFCNEETKSILPLIANKLGIQHGDIVELGLQLNEDIVVMHNGRMQAAFFAFPSGWSPHDKANMSLTEIHGPVADGDELRVASERITQMMCNGQGPWYRYVWTIAGSKNLSIHPNYIKPNPITINDLYFRYEYQTFDTVVLHETSVFLVKTVTIPYLDYVNTSEKHDMVVRVLNSMSNDVLTYKNLHKAKEILNQVKL